jgi:hypothetical protein
MLDTLFESSRWQHTDMYSDCDPSLATHHYFDASWDIAFERAQANSQREHEQRQLNGTSRKRTRNSSTVSEGVQSSVPVPSLSVLPLRKNGHSNSSANTPRAPDPEGALFSDIIADDDISIADPDPLVSTMQSSEVPAEVASQHRPLHEASPLIVPARTPIGDDPASPLIDGTIPIVSQLGSLDSPSLKRIKISGTFSDVTSESFPSIMLSHLNSLVSQFESFGDAEPFSDHSTESIDFAAMQSLIDKRNFTFDGISIDGIFNCDNPLAFAAGTKNNPDILSQGQMFKAHDQAKFLECQVPEIKGLCDANVFEFRDMSRLPSGARLLNAIWSYRRKRRPDGVLLKYKSRICADGSQQQHGIDYWETYAPVVHWSTVRMVLVLSALLKLKARQVDYTQAFPQAPLEDDVFMRIPQGWFFDPATQQLAPDSDDPRSFDKNHFIRLKRNLYGVKQAARNWYIHLKTGLLGRGFVQSKIDPCLFIRKDCLIVVYTDDCLFFANNDAIIDDLCKCLSTEFLLTDEGNVENFLGIKITHKLEDDQSVTISMTQTGLIDQILEDVGLVGDKVIQKKTPAKEILHAHENAAPFDAPWKYRSIIGKLNFLAQNTRPDISMAVHMCARYVTNPNRIHQDAVKYLCRYLHYTCTRGLILRPSGDNSLNAYVDSDFAGMWSRESCQLRDSAVSRTGYVIMYCNCPIHWISKLQTEIALSTTEAEYMALSMCLRDLLPMRTMMNELSKGFDFAGIPDLPLLTRRSFIDTRLHQSVVYEDNTGCLELANKPDQFRPRTKHIGIKWHHFRDAVKNGSVVVKKIDTTMQLADPLTKPLPLPSFEALRKLLMGW